MSEPTTSGGGSGQNEAFDGESEGPGELAGAVPQSSLAATKRTTDAERERVVQLLSRYQELAPTAAAAGLDPDQVAEDLQYAIDAVCRFPKASDVIAITVDDYAESLALQREGIELNRRSVAAYEDRAERAAASNERIAAALEGLLGLVRKAWDEENASGR